MDINFELYKIFYHAAKSGSFSAAADKLYISQSAVSQSIKCLEEKIGGKLFFRKSRNVQLTLEGELLFQHIEQAYNFIKTAESKLTEIRNLEFGEISIGASDTICKYFIIPYLESFLKKYPKIKIRVINRTSSQILSLLKNGIIDFGIATLPVNDKNFAVENFITVEDIFIASNKFSELKGKALSINELSSYPLLLLQKNSTTRNNMESYLNKNGISITPEIELESVDLLVDFAKIGLGIAHVLKESALNLILHDELFEVKINENLPLRELGIITMKGVPLSRASTEFIGFLRQEE